MTTIDFCSVNDGCSGCCGILFPFAEAANATTSGVNAIVMCFTASSAVGLDEGRRARDSIRHPSESIKGQGNYYLGRGPQGSSESESSAVGHGRREDLLIVRFVAAKPDNCCSEFCPRFCSIPVGVGKIPFRV